MQRKSGQSNLRRRFLGILIGGMAVAASGLVHADDATPPHVLGSRSFTIPFTVDSSQIANASVELLVADVQPATLDQWQSNTNGDSTEVRWSAAAIGSTDLPEFSYTATKDGEFWFTTRTLRAGQQSVPTDQLKLSQFNQRDVLKVLVDTTPPEIEVVADADGDGKIRTDVVIEDATKITQVDVRYVTDIAQTQWQLVPYHASGSLQFRPPGDWDETVVVITALDSAGNKQSVQETIRRPRVAAVPVQRYAAVPQRSYDARPAPYRAGSNSQSRSTATQRSTEAFAVAARSEVKLPPPATPEQIGLGFAEPDLAPAPLAKRPPMNNADVGPEIIGSGLPTPDREPQIPLPKASPPSLNSALPQEPAATSNPRPSSVAEAIKPIDAPSALPLVEVGRDDSVRSGRVDVDSNRPALPPKSPVDDIADEDLASIMQRVPVRYSDSHRFSLDYEVQALGNRGVDAIELYGTVDRGQSWSLWGRDADRSTPFDIEVRDDGLFGFRIVVVGQSGLNSPRPLAGEEPDIFVVVDRDEPEIRITGAQYGRGDEIGSLVIEYDCQDKNLKSRPITLAFGKTIDGPWTTIAGGLQNNGRYAWPADPKLPRAFFLRIDATDASGNVGTYILDRPIDAQGLAPRAKIRGFRSL